MDPVYLWVGSNLKGQSVSNYRSQYTVSLIYFQLWILNLLPLTYQNGVPIKVGFKLTVPINFSLLVNFESYKMEQRRAYILYDVNMGFKI